MTNDINDLLNALEQLAIKDDIPIVDKATAKFLAKIVSEKQPKNILEIGTAIGYSGIIMLLASPKANLITIERSLNRVIIATDTFTKSGVTDRVKIINADVFEFLESNTQKFDFIFLDGAKNQYPKLLSHLKSILTKSGTLVTDNVQSLKHSNFSPQILLKIKEFRALLKQDPDLHTEFLNIGDGISVSIKK
ncbi:MAG: O-methyltransferase [Firmicutes bacterium]|nr:O-methyltransferase [Bacillota bacterium]